MVLRKIIDGNNYTIALHDFYYENALCFFIERKNAHFIMMQTSPSTNDSLINKNNLSHFIYKQLLNQELGVFTGFEKDLANDLASFYPLTKYIIKIGL